MSARCPHCGGNTAEGASVWRGRWWVTPAYADLDGERVDLPRNLARVLYAIAYANGEPITHHNLPHLSAQTLAGHVRAIRRALGDRCPIREIAGRGYAWDARA